VQSLLLAPEYQVKAGATMHQRLYFLRLLCTQFWRRTQGGTGIEKKDPGSIFFFSGLWVDYSHPPANVTSKIESSLKT